MSLRIFKPVFAAALLVFLIQGTSSAHFGMVIPSDNMVMQDDSRQITVDLSFSHPFERNGMELAKPQSFFVERDGHRENLLNKLVKTKILGHTAWKTLFTVKRPGVYTFCMIPKPYWEPAEDHYIQHCTKTIVAAFGSNEGWDKELGVKTEIVPLSKPYGLYAGNVFQGIVKLNGKIVPFSTIEIEYDNEKNDVKAPTDYMTTQTIKADKNGVFTYAAPAAGWWGFAALNTSDKKIMHNGEPKEVELGAVLWVKFEKWQQGNK